MNIKLDLEKLSPVARLAAAPLLGALFVLFLPIAGFAMVALALTRVATHPRTIRGYTPFSL